MLAVCSSLLYYSLCYFIEYTAVYVENINFNFNISFNV